MQKGITITTGVKFRHNAVSGTDGNLVLTDLEPQSYFVKPFFKEHSFTPAFVTVDLSVDFETVIDIMVTRIAYGLSGYVYSVVGIPMANITGNTIIVRNRTVYK